MANLKGTDWLKLETKVRRMVGAQEFSKRVCELLGVDPDDTIDIVIRMEGTRPPIIAIHQVLRHDTLDKLATLIGEAGFEERHDA